MNVIQYKCPNCGGELKFDPASGHYTCEYCRSEFTQEEADKQTQAKAMQAEQTPPASDNEDNEEGKVYTCPSCGATIVTDDTTAATFCFYCHNPVVLSGRLEGRMKPDYVIPFKIDKEKATDIFLNWLKKKRYIPKDFYSKDQLEKITGVYFPYMLYTCNVKGHIKARGTSTSISQIGREEITESRIYDVVRDGDMEVRHVLRNALRKNDKVLAENVIPYDTEEMQPFNMSYLSGFFAEKRDLGKDDFETEVREEISGYAVSELRSSISAYDRVEILENDAEIKDEKWEYALLPVWTLTYKEKGSDRIYYFSVNGQSGKTVGELPLDKKKLLRVFLGYFAAVLAVLLAIFYFIF